MGLGPTQRRGALHAASCPSLGAQGPHGTPPIWGFTNITNVLVSCTSKFTDILEFISKFTNVLGLDRIGICYFISIIFHAIILHGLPIFLGGSSFRGITRFK